MTSFAVDVEGLAAIAKVARSLDVSKEWRREIKDAGRPMVADARTRFRNLGGSKASTTARSVGMSTTNDGIFVKVGGPKHPWARPKEFGARRQATRRHDVSNAFGRGVSLSGITKTIDYSSPRIFGSFQKDGKAFFPAVREGRRNLEIRLTRLRDGFVHQLAKAA